jgi:AbrB family looped-hinge helix DNA binding protein
MSAIVNVSEAGRLSLPAQVRKKVGLEKGGPVAIWVDGDEIHVRAVKDVMAALQAEAASVFSGSDESVDQFLAGRHCEAEREIGS